MIVGIGIDSVDIARFDQWHKYSLKKLSRIYSDAEVAYCLEIPLKSAERFAVRFAAREALYKALSPLLVKPIPFLTLCRAITIEYYNNAPVILADWHTLTGKQRICHMSLTHSKTMATAVVVLEHKN